MVAPSLVTVIALRACSSPMLTRILSMPLGPSVVLTRSATAIAPTKDCYKKVSECEEGGSFAFHKSVPTAAARNQIVTYQSSHLAAVFGRAALQNLRKDVLQR
jgi:hypothetical protein